MRRYLLIGGPLLGLGAVGLYGATAATATRAANPPAAAVEAPPQPVRVFRVASADALERSYTGVVRARYEPDLAFRVGGKVVARPVEVGDRVKAGQEIARLDPTDFELTVKAAEADVAVARADAANAAAEDDRARGLSGTGAVSRSELDRARDQRAAAVARLERAERNLALARNRLAYCVLRADADGVVTALPVEVGQVVTEGQTVAKVARAGDLEAVVGLPENRLADARTPARVTVWGEAGPGYPAALRELCPAADAASRTYQARFRVDDPGPEFALGRTVTVHLAPAGGRAGLVVPLTAIRQQDGAAAVWRVDGDRLVSVPVGVAAYRDDAAVVAGGLKPGDVIVAAGVQKLDAGLRVRPWEGN